MAGVGIVSITGWGATHATLRERFPRCEFRARCALASWGDPIGFELGKGPGGQQRQQRRLRVQRQTVYTFNGADKLSTCSNCKACSNGSVTSSGDHGISGTIADSSPCVNLKTEKARATRMGLCQPCKAQAKDAGSAAVTHYAELHLPGPRRAGERVLDIGGSL